MRLFVIICFLTEMGFYATLRICHSRPAEAGEIQTTANEFWIPTFVGMTSLCVPRMFSRVTLCLRVFALQGSCPAHSGSRPETPQGRGKTLQGRGVVKITFVLYEGKSSAPRYPPARPRQSGLPAPMISA